jgi:beta-phosphoglucomutase family hydrolase
LIQTGEIGYHKSMTNAPAPSVALSAATTAPAEHLVPMPLEYTPGGIIFDCDGTLADTMPLHFVAWRETLDKLGCPFPEEQFYAWGGVTAHEIVARLNTQHGLTMPVEQTAHDKEETYKLLIPQVKAIPEVMAEVERFHGKTPLAVASGGMRPVVEETLLSLGIRHYFETVAAAEDVKHGKPAPDVFLVAAERIGVAPENCVVYEDAPAGLEAARRAGMKAVNVLLYIGQ